MLKQTENSVKIEGILSEIDLDYGSFVKNGATVESIGGTIKVQVTQKINGEDAILEVPVHMFASKLTNKGTSNPAYESIEKIKTSYVSIAAGGIDAADRVRITGGSIQMNEYYNQNGELRSSTKLVNIYPLEELPNLDVLPKKQAAEVNSGNKDNYWGNAFGSAAPASDIPF